MVEFYCRNSYSASDRHLSFEGRSQPFATNLTSNNLNSILMELSQSSNQSNIA